MVVAPTKALLKQHCGQLMNEGAAHGSDTCKRTVSVELVIISEAKCSSERLLPRYNVAHKHTVLSN